MDRNVLRSLGFGLLVLFLWLATNAAADARAEDRRIALVIGNSAYRQAPLTNPVNDAKAMARTLGTLGFTVTKLENASRTEMATAIQAFGDGIKRGGVGLFYFAGHGVQMQGANFLLPVDATIEDVAHVEAQAIDARVVLQEMSNAKNRLNLLILDACRDNPFIKRDYRGLRVQPADSHERPPPSVSGGLAPMEALVGTLIAFATAPDSVAADGAGRNGVYTENLLRNISEPGLRVEEVFKRTRFAVRQQTSGRQVPWENTSLEEDFFFVPSPAGPTPSATSTPSGSGFSFSREEEKDRAARHGRDSEIRARLEAPCPESLRKRPIVIDVSEESRKDGLVLTERSSRFAELIGQQLQQAGLKTRLAHGGSPTQGTYAIQGVVTSQQGANPIARLGEASVNAELALRDPAGRFLQMVEVSGATFTGQGADSSAQALMKEQARDASSQLYAAFCGAGS